MEMEPSRAFYRIQISAKDVPLSDELELTIFTKNGEQLARIRGICRPRRDGLQCAGYVSSSSSDVANTSRGSSRGVCP